MEPPEVQWRVGNLTALSDADFRWDIPNFRTFPNMKDFWVCSPTFSWGNSIWLLRLFPNGIQTQHYQKSWALLDLIRQKDHSQIHTVKFKIGVIARIGGIYQHFENSGVYRMYDLAFGGQLEFVDRARMQRSCILPNYEVSFSCTMEPFKLHASRR